MRAGSRGYKHIHDKNEVRRQNTSQISNVKEEKSEKKQEEGYESDDDEEYSLSDEEIAKENNEKQKIEQQLHLNQQKEEEKQENLHKPDEKANQVGKLFDLGEENDKIIQESEFTNVNIMESPFLAKSMESGHFYDDSPPVLHGKQAEMDNEELKEYFKKKNRRARQTAIPEVIIFHLHGGGWISQSPRTHMHYLRIWAKLTHCPVLSIDYGLPFF